MSNNNITVLDAVLYALDCMPSAEAESALYEALKPEVRAKVEEHDLCASCKQRVRENFMVTDEVWAQAGNPPRSQMHLSCLETKLGHPLASEHFIEAPVNAAILWAFSR